jgi:lysozyme
MAELRGIDVSNHQQAINWPQVAASGITFAVIKATDGDTFIDPYWSRNWQPARAAGLARGAYHYAELYDAVTEARWFCAQVQDLQAGDFLALDLEVEPDNGGDLSAWALTWLKTVQALTGVKPWLYTYWGFVGAYLTNAALADYPLWIADLSAAPPAPPPPWGLISMWQYSWTGNVPGITGNVDMDTFFGTAEQLAQLGKQDMRRKVNAATGLKRSPWHGGPNLAQIPDQGEILDSGRRQAGFGLVQWTSLHGWIDATHIVPLPPGA